MKKSEVIIRPATLADIEQFAEERLQPSVKAWCAEQDGEIIALGGVAYYSGRWFAFMDMTDKMRPHKIKLARAARRFFDELRSMGIKFIYAEADLDEPTALRWMASLGFSLDPRTGYLYRWRA